MQKSFFLSILALDSYNRGYNSGLAELGSENGRLGNARIFQVTENQKANWQSIGFYAVSYNVSGVSSFSGTSTIISYRGTDDFNPLSGASDIWNGWTVGAGFNSGSQARLAIEYYQNLTGGSLYDSAASVQLTGHSLGGGLAGFVGALATKASFGFDHMPFGQAALAEATGEALRRALIQVDLIELSFSDLLLFLTSSLPTVPNNVFDEFVDTFLDELNALAPWLGTMSGYYLEGEVLNAVRDLPPNIIGVPGANFVAALFGIPSIVAYFSTLGISSTHFVNTQVEDVVLSEVNNYGMDLSAVELHTMSLLTITMFGEQEWDGSTFWQSSFKHIGKHVISDDIGTALGRVAAEGPNDGTGEATPGGQLGSMIAYSAIDEGVRPFGDTGIRALFNDADDLGYVTSITGSALPAALQSNAVKDFIGATVAEYAGLLASEKVFQSDLPTALEGVLNKDSGDSSLLVDLTSKTWSLENTLGSPHAISKKSDLIQAIIAFGGPTLADTVNSNLADWLSSSLEEAVDTIEFMITGTNTRFKTEAGHFGLVVGMDTGSSIEVTYGPAVVIGGSGTDHITGSSAGDALYGGAGTDTLVGGGGSDWFHGGGGDTTIWGDNEGGGGSRDKDIVRYSGAAGTTRIAYEGLSSQPYLQVTHSVGGQQASDKLYDIEEVWLESGQTSLDVNGSIAAGTDITIRNGIGGVQTIIPRDFGNGVVLMNPGSSGTGYIRDKNTKGQIKLIGFNTQVIGTDYDDDLYDYSVEEKVVSAGDGDDIVEVGSGDAIIFGGEGYDLITGGDGDDIIMDANSRLASGHGLWGTAQGEIDSGAGNDIILVSLPKDLTDDSWSIDAPVYSVDAGEGDDHLTLDFFRGRVDYYYQAGDGDDVIAQNSQADYVYHSTMSFEGLHIYQPEINISLAGYDAADVSVTWSQEELYLISEDIPNRDGGNYWLQRGTVVVSFAGGGSITVNNVYGVVYSFLPDWAELPMGQGHGEPIIGFSGIDGDISATIIPGGFARAANSGAQLSFREAPAPQSLLSGDQDVDLKRGEHSYVGGAGHDRLNISWDPSTLVASVDGATLTITDRWGVIGTTNITDFDEIYVLAEDQSYTPAEFFEAFSDGGDNDLVGSAGGDLLTGNGGRDRLFGDGGDDTLTGLGGHDILDGGSGADIMAGGAGDDIYYIDDEDDVVIEAANEGRDKVHSSVNIALAANVEDVALLGAAIAATGNGLDNRISGNQHNNLLVGGGGNDRLDGAAGDDELDGGDGDDLLFGGDGDDLLTGGVGKDSLSGQGGSDILIGGAGDDIYYVDDFFDSVIEAAGQGYDVVYSAVEMVIPDNVEELRLREGAYWGSANASGGKIYGNDQDNELLGDVGVDIFYGGGGNDYVGGGDANDVLFGEAGDDQIWGGDGNDLLYGGSGSDWLEGDYGSDLIVGSGMATMADVGRAVARQGADILGVEESDTAFYFGIPDDYAITALGNGWFTVENLASLDPEIDYLVNIDQLAFFDAENPEAELVYFSLQSPSVVGEIPDSALTEDQVFSIEILDEWFVDPNSGALAYSVTLSDGSPLPSWVSFDGEFLTGTPPVDFNGKFHLLLSATGATGVISTPLVLDVAPVNDAPTVSEALGLLEVSESDAISFTVPPLTFDDVDGDALTFTADLSNGSPLPGWLTFDGQTLSGIIPSGFYTEIEVRITASDGSLSVADILTIAPAPTARAMTLPKSAADEFQLQIFEREAALPGVRYLSQTIDEVQWHRGNQVSSFVPRNFDHKMWSGPAVHALEPAPELSAATDFDRQIAIMLQDMSTFGAEAGGEGLVSWQRDNVRPYEYFA
jgi:Ca2+-binding RTX toxin-like protein